jgi:hypothetical protein
MRDLTDHSISCQKKASDDQDYIVYTFVKNEHAQKIQMQMSGVCYISLQKYICSYHLVVFMLQSRVSVSVYN